MFSVSEIVAQYTAESLDEKFEPEAKHMNQQNKIVDWMVEQGMLDKPVSDKQQHVFIEYGAGRAGLSSYVADRLQKNQVERPEDFEFMIIDRDTRRNKLDKNFRETFRTTREKMDIAHFHLEKFLESHEAPEGKEQRSLLSIAKHLCGGATDLTLVSVINQRDHELKGVCIATCCHH